jgi:hypothetical protein
MKQLRAYWIQNNLNFKYKTEATTLVQSTERLGIMRTRHGELYQL